MYETEKLREAEHFLHAMRASSNEPDEFKFHLSAFLSAARSVLQYAREEAAKLPGGQTWYDSKTSVSQVLKFFKSKRDINIHRKPVAPSRHISISVTDRIVVSESVRIEVRKEDGTIEVREHKGEQPQPQTRETPAEVSIVYLFDDWNGPENVVDLSSHYLAALRIFVKAGMTDGFISG